MKPEYIDLPTMGDVWKAKQEGLRIEVCSISNDWAGWSGEYWQSNWKFRAIKPLPEYYSFEKDEKVMVRNFDSEELERRHFSHVGANGRPRCFSDGKTSFTAKPYDATAWNFCRRPTKEELGE